MTRTGGWAVAMLGVALHLGGCGPGASAGAPVVGIEPAPGATLAPALGPSAPAVTQRRIRPTVPTQTSCEKARAWYIENYDRSEPPDLSAGAYGAVLNKGRYLAPCGVPSSTEVRVCAAVQHGRAVGVTVNTVPADDAMAACIANAVRALEFPSHSRLDVTISTFAAAN